MVCSLHHSQCAIPVFDGLFDEPHNTTVMELLFTMAHWHSLAKLRMHHDLLLDCLDEATKTLGVRLRKFSQRTCPAFDTKELPREYNTRIRRETKQAAYASHAEQTTEPVSAEHRNPGECLNTNNASAPLAENHCTKKNPNVASRTLVPISKTRTSRRRHKTLNINTYKFHSYGDYARTIRTYGTMDSYSTEPVRDW